MICMVVCSTVAGFIPNLWGAGFFSMSSVLLTAAGGFFGIWLGVKLGDYF